MHSHHHDRHKLTHPETPPTSPGTTLELKCVKAGEVKLEVITFLHTYSGNRRMPLPEDTTHTPLQQRAMLQSSSKSMQRSGDEKRTEVNVGWGWWTLMKGDLIKDCKAGWNGEDCGTEFRGYGSEGQWRRASEAGQTYSAINEAEHKLLSSSADVCVSLKGWIHSLEIHISSVDWK